MSDRIFKNFKRLSSFEKITSTYYVNWSKVKDIEDFKLLLTAVDFHMTVTDDIKMFAEIKHFLEEDNA